MRLSTVAAMRRMEPALDVHRVGQADMPRFGTPDQDILAFCEMSDRLLVTLDRASMPAHVVDHLATGRHMAGVLLVTPGCSFRQLLDDLLLIWSCSTAEEWRDVIHFLPFS
ncbi:MAG: DUF5615 family PIN-like protein [Candidatus Saccharimonas sp.]|nr:DUF5615 family PIN-like protein [Planctomycetaceae bacterium]